MQERAAVRDLKANNPTARLAVYSGLYHDFLETLANAHDVQKPPKEIAYFREQAIRLSGVLTEQSDLWTRDNLWIVTDKFETRRLIYKPTQLKLLAKIREMQDEGLPVRLLVLKARQMGMSTLIASWIFNQVIFRENSRAVVMADTGPHGTNLFNMYRTFYDKLPEALRPPEGVGSRNGRKLVFDEKYINGFIEVYVSGESKTEDSGRTGRSATLRYQHLSEFDYYANPDATYNSVKQTVPNEPNTAVFIETTARGYGSSFHTIWEETLAGKRDYGWLFLGWQEDPSYRRAFRTPEAKEKFAAALGQTESDEYGNECLLRETYTLTLEQLHWRRYKIRNDFFGEGSKDGFVREYPMTAEEAFRGATYKYIASPSIAFHMKRVQEPLFVGNLIQDPKIKNKLDLKPDPSGYIRIWEKPMPYSEYILGGDTAEGIASRDFNVGMVGKRRAFGKPVPVARIMGSDHMPLSLAMFAEMMVQVGTWYNNAWLIPENNFDSRLIDFIADKFGYRNVIYERQIRTHGLRYSEASERVGWRSTQNSRKYVLGLLKEFFETDYEDVIVRDRDFLLEAMELEANPQGRVSAPLKGVRRTTGEGYHKYCDDICFAFGAVLLGDEVLGQAKTEEELQEAAFERETRKYFENYHLDVPLHRDTNSLRPNFEALGI